jgi:LuxR family maltose regulon positive regulatory protein
MNQIAANVQNDILIYQEHGSTVEVMVGTAGWYRWVATSMTFAFESSEGRFTARCEQAGNKRGGKYWKAYRRSNGKLVSFYLGKSDRLTLARLKAAAAMLAGMQDATTPRSMIGTVSEATSQNLPPYPLEEDIARSEPLGVSDQFLVTKLFVPISPHALISRSWLFAQLDEGLHRSLTLVSAPAGFGKTTLLSAWVRSRPKEHLRVAWVSLDEGDNTPERFWEYGLSALNQSEPGIAQRALRLLRDPQASPLEPVLTSLINALTQTMNKCVLILDDYQVITEPAVHTSLTYLVEHLPPQLHLILLTRTDPPLPLARLRSQGQVLEVRTDQLSATVEEVTNLFQEVMGISLPGDILQEVTARTEGWLAGLQLAGLSLQGRADPVAVLNELSGGQRYILDYLIEEVLLRQPACMQRFLLHTAILGCLCAPLCDAVMERTGSQELLESLERANVFVVPLDGSRRWYRYQAFFAEALRHRLEQVCGEDVPGLHHRASIWYAEEGQINEAVGHAILAQEWQRVADLIEQVRFPFAWGEGQRDLVMFRDWLQQLPESVVRSRPSLCLAYAHTLCFIAPATTIEAWLAAAEATLVAQTSEEERHLPREWNERENLLGEIATFRAYYYFLLGDEHPAQVWCQEALAHISPKKLAVGADVTFAQALAYYYTDQAAASTQRLLEAATFAKTVRNTCSAIFYMSLAAHTLILQGKLREAWRVTEQAIQLGEEASGPKLAEVCFAYCQQANILQEWNWLDEALDLLAEASRLSEQAGAVAFAFTGNTLLAHIYRERGELDAAVSAFRPVEHLPVQLDSVRTIYAIVEQVRLWLAQGQLEQASHWAEALEQPERCGPPFASSREEVARVHILLAQHRPALALQLLSPLLARTQTRQNWGTVIELLLLQVLAHEMLCDVSKALDALSEAVRLAEPEGYVRSFVDEGAPMAALLSTLREQERKKGSTPYLDTLLAAFQSDGMRGEPGDPPPGRHGQYTRYEQSQLLDPLSERELEVLRLVERGASNKEVAEALVLAVNTVKRHVGNIMSKLQARNRTQAIVEARKFGLLSDVS